MDEQEFIDVIIGGLKLLELNVLQYRHKTCDTGRLADIHIRLLTTINNIENYKEKEF